MKYENTNEYKYYIYSIWKNTNILLMYVYTHHCCYVELFTSFFLYCFLKNIYICAP